MRAQHIERERIIGCFIYFPCGNDHTACAGDCRKVCRCGRTDGHHAGKILSFNRAVQNGRKLNAVSLISPFWREEARALDEAEDRAVSDKPLYGIPVLVKDNIEVKGLPF